MKVAEIKISYEPKMKMSECPKVNSSRDAYNILKSKFEGSMLVRESSFMLVLNMANRVKGCYPLSVGGIGETVMDPQIVLAVAIKSLSVGVIVAHNHPSGNLNPSGADIKTTNELSKACKAVKKTLMDHLIITEEGYYSFADEGML